MNFDSVATELSSFNHDKQVQVSFISNKCVIFSMICFAENISIYDNAIGFNTDFADLSIGEMVVSFPDEVIIEKLENEYVLNFGNSIVSICWED